MIETTAKPKFTLPAPGVYRDVPFDVYRAWPAVNKSTLDHIHTHSPLHCKYRMDNPEEDTPAMLIGRALHTRVLDGSQTFMRDFVVAPECDRRTKDGKAVWAAFLDVADGRTVLTQEQAAVVDAMYEGVWANADVRDFLNSSPAQEELSLVWRDPETGLMCKARLDLLRPDWNAIADLKTCLCAHPDRFARAIEEYGYHRQGAFYLRGAAALSLGVEHFALCPVEKEAPHVSALYIVDEDSLAIGDAEVMAALRTYADCKRSGDWPGYPKPAGGFAKCGLPAWAKRRASNDN